MRIICIALATFLAIPFAANDAIRAQDVEDEFQESPVQQMGVIQLRTTDETGSDIQVFSATTNMGNAFFTMESPPFLPGDKFSMLSNPAFQQELGLADEQKKQIEELSKEFSQKMSDRFKNHEGGRMDLGNAEDIKEFVKSINEQKISQMGKVLLPHQLERLNQISLQMEMQQRGDVQALTSQKLKQELGIDDEQQQRLRDRAKEIKAELEKDIAALRDQARQELLDELTSDQRAKLESMLGDKFEYQPSSIQERIRNLRNRKKSRAADSDRD